MLAIFAGLIGGDNHKIMTDGQIIIEIERNPESGFRFLVAEYSQRIYWHIRRMVISHQDAEAITQETFVRIFKSINNLNSVGALKSWIYRIASNETLRALEKRKENVFVNILIIVIFSAFVMLPSKAENNVPFYFESGTFSGRRINYRMAVSSNESTVRNVVATFIGE